MKTEAELLVAGVRNDLERKMLAFFRGREAEAVIEMVRGLDIAMIVSWFLPEAERDATRNKFRANMLFGARATIGPLLSRIGRLNGIPWQPSDPNRASHVDQVLARFGEISVLQRLTALERYGLATSKVGSSKHIELHITGDDVEAEEREALRGLLQSSRPTDRDPDWDDRHRDITRRVEQYARIWRGHFIEYDNDWDIVEHYRREAERMFAHRFAEYEALPNAAVIGGATFSSWRKAATEAGARVLMHMQFAARLQALNHDLNLRNLHTIFVTAGDARRVLRETGLSEVEAKEFQEVTTMTATMPAEDEHEIPAPLYIALGERYRLLPCFGVMLNPYTDLVRALKRRHRADWDRAVAGREPIFRNDIQTLFSGPRFHVPSSGVQLRRNDGTVLTDVDAIALDRESGALALFQLKWFDVVGFSLRERHSRHINLTHANDWIQKVNQWLEARSTDQLASDLRLPRGIAIHPYIFVVGRHGTGFTDSRADTSNAAWIGWPRLLDRMKRLERDADPIARLHESGKTSRRHTSKATSKRFELPELTVDVTIG